MTQGESAQIKCVFKKLFRRILTVRWVNEIWACGWLSLSVWKCALFSFPWKAGPWKAKRRHLNRHTGDVGDTSTGNVDGFKAGGVWSLPWSGQSSGCWGKSFFQFLLLCSVFCLFLTTDIPWVCFALCCSGFRRTQSKDSEWTFESSPGGEAQQQPNLAVWNAAGERALGRSEPGSVSSAPSEVQKHQRKDRCSLCGCH